MGETQGQGSGMAERDHHYTVVVEWTGNSGSGTSGYAAYERSHRITAGGKGAIEGSSDPLFRGDAGRWNPAELLIASLSACHQLWYLHLCAVNRVRVVEYRDAASGIEAEHGDGSGEFTRVVLRPEVVIAEGCDPETALRLHHEAARMCFIARSVNFPVEHEPTVRVEGA
jgi:organic hydroperoxide reductase OsmC/OhrA